MKHKYIPALGLVGMLLSSGCSTTSNHDAASTNDKPANGAVAPVYNISPLRSGAADVLYCSASFLHKNGRWPNDYAELSAFVKQSNGYLTLGDYERVDLKPVADGGLEIRYARPGQTNETTLTLNGTAEKK